MRACITQATRPRSGAIADYSRTLVRGANTALRSAVIGLGRVGQGYDYDSSGDAAVLTHASAFALHDRFDLVAGVDPDPAQRERFAAKFGAPALGSVEELGSKAPIDVVAVATPAAAHSAGVDAGLALAARAIVCEKPIAAHAGDAEAIVAACERRGAALLVNYMRRFEPSVIEIREQLAAGAIGEVRAGVGWYPGGLLENGSHMVDLIDFLLGPVEQAAVLAADDEAPAARLTAAGAIVHLLPAPTGGVNVFQLELIGTSGSLRYLQSGMSYAIHGTTRPRRLAHVEVLGAGGDLRPTDLPRYGLHVLDGLVRHLDQSAPLLSDGRSALRALRVCESLLPRAAGVRS